MRTHIERSYMYNDTIKLLNLEQFNLKIEKIDTVKRNNVLYCYITLKNQKDSCPICSSIPVIHGYKIKTIKHSISNNNPCFIIYRARRFYCKTCKHTYYEKNPFALKNDKLSTYTIYAVLNDLKDHTVTFKNVAVKYNLSVTSVINIFDTYIDSKRRTLPEVICIDEFYTSKKRQYKYACVFLDFISKKIIYIYPSRRKDRLTSELSFIPKNERLNVKYVVIDMWDTYRDLASIYFPNCMVAVDSFHVIRHLNDAIDSIRIKTMKKYDKRTNKLVQNDIYYYMLKKFHFFFTMSFEKIFNGQTYIHKMKTKWTKHEIRSYLFSINTDLRDAYFLKERYREFNLTADYETCDEELELLIDEFLNSKHEEFRTFGKLLIHWKVEIKNSFIRYQGKRLSNGPIEGANSRIKTILKSANGYTNFNRLRNRIMYSLNKDIPIKGNPKRK